jgi:hypothetical protein
MTSFTIQDGAFIADSLYPRPRRRQIVAAVAQASGEPEQWWAVLADALTRAVIYVVLGGISLAAALWAMLLIICNICSK